MQVKSSDNRYFIHPSVVEKLDVKQVMFLPRKVKNKWKTIDDNSCVYSC